MESKHALKSKTVWASIVSLISWIVVFFSVHGATEKEVAVNGALWSLFAIYGRIVAKHKLYLKKQK